MKSNAVLVVVGLAALIIGVIVGLLIFGPKPTPADIGPAKYILMFGDSTSSSMVTADLTGLQNALASPVPNWSTLQEVPGEGLQPAPVPIPTPVGAPSGTLLVSRIQITQSRRDSGPCTMHVTQKVGLNDPIQVTKVLAALKPESTPWPPPAK